MPRKIRVNLMPKIVLKIPGKGKPAREMIEGYYRAVSDWSTRIYPKVIAKTPRYSGPDSRRRPGFVASHIKLMWTTGAFQIRYRTIGVPGGSKIGSPAWHALMAIYSLHQGWRRPFIRRPREKRVMTFPLKKGERFRNPRTARWAPGARGGPKTWVVTRKAVQRRGPTRNTWIRDIVRENLNDLNVHWTVEVEKLKRRKKKIEFGRA